MGRVVIGRVVRGASCLLGELSWGELSVGRVVSGASCPWGELSLGRVVPGASFLWGELSVGRVSMGRVVREPVIMVLIYPLTTIGGVSSLSCLEALCNIEETKLSIIALTLMVLTSAS
jgi:hypothetical protein